VGSPKFELHIPVMSMSVVLGSTLTPARVPHVAVEEGLVTQWGERLSERWSCHQVGTVSQSPLSGVGFSLNL
jgi:hypothetical protein